MVAQCGFGGREGKVPFTELALRVDPPHVVVDVGHLLVADRALLLLPHTQQLVPLEVLLLHIAIAGWAFLPVGLELLEKAKVGPLNMISEVDHPLVTAGLRALLLLLRSIHTVHVSSQQPWIFEHLVTVSTRDTLGIVMIVGVVLFQICKMFLANLTKSCGNAFVRDLHVVFKRTSP